MKVSLGRMRMLRATIVANKGSPIREPYKSLKYTHRGLVAPLLLQYRTVVTICCRNTLASYIYTL